MSDDRLYVDVPALNRGGINLERYALLARSIAGDMRQATLTYQNAGGTGEMGEKFDTNYKPGERKALEFLALLDEIIGGGANRTLLAARNFENTSDDADASTPK